MGNLYVAFSMITFFGMFLITPVGQYFARKFNTWHIEKTTFHHLCAYNIYLLFILILTAIMNWIVYSFFSVGHGFTLYQFITLITLLVYIGAWNQTLLPALNMLHKRVAFTLLTSLTLLIGLISSILMVKTFYVSAFYWLMGSLIATALITFLAIFYFNSIVNEPKLKPSKWLSYKFSMSSIKKVFIFAAPLAIGTFFMWIQISGYRLIIEQRFGLEFLGLFSVGMAISSQIGASVESIALQYFTPHYYQEIAKNDKITQIFAFNRIINTLLPMYLAITIWVSLSASYLMTILVNQTFYQAYIYVIYGAWIEFFRMSSNILLLASQSEMKTKSTIFPYFIGAAIIAGGLVVIPYSATSSYSSIILLIAGIVMLFFLFINMNKLVLITLSWPIFTKTIIISSPLFLLLFINKPLALITSILVAGLSGLYLLWVLGIIWKNSLRLYDNKMPSQ